MRLALVMTTLFQRDAKGRFMARQPATLPSHAIFPKRRAVPPVSWPLQRHDRQAVIFTICVTAIFWQQGISSC